MNTSMTFSSMSLFSARAEKEITNMRVFVRQEPASVNDDERRER